MSLRYGLGRSSHPPVYWMPQYLCNHANHHNHSYQGTKVCRSRCGLLNNGICQVDCSCQVWMTKSLSCSHPFFMVPPASTCQRARSADKLTSQLSKHLYNIRLRWVTSFCINLWQPAVRMGFPFHAASLHLFDQIVWHMHRLLKLDQG